MTSRKKFVSAAAASVSVLLAAPALGQAMDGASPAAPAAPAPHASSKVSDAARAFALRMRAFDPKLTDQDLDVIATGVDQNFQIGNTVNHKGQALKNWDEPVTRFEVKR